MAYNASVPQNSDSPSLFPAQAQENFGRLLTVIGADHQFNLTAAANDGYHNLINMTIQAPTGALASTGRLYAKVVGSHVQMHYMDSNGVEYQVTPGIVAAANFDGSGADGAIVPRSAYNVTSVTKTTVLDNSKYRVTFTTPQPDTNYIVHVTGMRTSINGECSGQIYGAAAYATSVDVAYVDIGFNRGSSTYVGDIVMGNVIIYRAS